MANTAINIFGNSGEAMVGVDTLNDIIAGKQATLVSGTNIKTVNGNTLLGSGDVELTASDVGALPNNTVIPTGIEAADPADGTWTINLSNGNTITMDLNHTHPQYQPLLTAGTNISIAEDNQTGDLVISATGGGSSGNVGNLNTNNTSALTVSSSESFSGNISLHKISKTGSYNDLTNKPTIPTSSDIDAAKPFIVTLSSSNGGDTISCDKTNAEIYAASQSGRDVIVYYGTYQYRPSEISEDYAIFTGVDWDQAMLRNIFEINTSGNIQTVNYSSASYEPSLTFDNTPTQNSNNPVKSGGVYTALQGKENKSIELLSSYSTLLEALSGSSQENPVILTGQALSQFNDLVDEYQNAWDYQFKFFNTPLVVPEPESWDNSNTMNFFMLYGGGSFTQSVSMFSITKDGNNYWITNSTRALQSQLVSGTNIKTINNQSLLGSGNLTLSNIGASSVNAKSIYAEYNQSTDTFIFTDSNSNNVTQSQFREYCNDLTLYVELIFNISNVSSDNFWHFPKSLGIYQPNRDADYWTFAMFIDPRVGTTSLTLYWDSTNNKVRVEEFIDEHEIIPNVANNLTTTSSGSALDATQGKALKDLIDGITVPQAATATPLVDGTAAVGSSTKYAKEDHVHPSDTNKQDTLVSGTNIKTINNQSLLGSGNLTPSDIGAITRFVVDFTLSGTTVSNPNKTFSEIKAAYDAGNLVLARDDAGSLYYLLYCETTSCGFFCSDSGMLYTIDVDSSDAWTYQDTSISQLELELSDKSQIIYMQKINNDWKKLTYNSLTGTWSVNNTTLTGNIKNIYLDKDNNDLYYWDGSEFVLIDEDNVQPDWNQSDSTKADYIKNKPTIPNSIKVGSVAGKLYRNNVAGSGNFTVTGNSGCIPNLTAGTFLVSIYAKSATQSYTFRFNFGSSVTYDLSTTNGEISDVRQITIPSNGTFSGLVLNGSVASGTILYVVMYNYLTPISTVGPAAVTNRYSDLDGTPTIPTVNNGTLTIKNHGVTVGTFTANQSGNTTADITTEVVTVSGTGSITQALDANKFYKFGSVSALTLTLNAAGSGLAIYAGKFTASANNISITLPSGTSITDSSVDIESGNIYEFSILDGVCIISDITTT